MKVDGGSKTVDSGELRLHDSHATITSAATTTAAAAAEVNLQDRLLHRHPITLLTPLLKARYPAARSGGGQDCGPLRTRPLRWQEIRKHARFSPDFRYGQQPFAQSGDPGCTGESVADSAADSGG